MRQSHLTKMIKYTNYLILIFMNINENVSNKTKLVEKLRGIPTKCPIRLLRTSLDYKTWYQIKVETLPLDLNDQICELSNLNIQEY